jgi:hypothetical protein
VIVGLLIIYPIVNLHIFYTNNKILFSTRTILLIVLKTVIVIYMISGIKAILQDSSVKIADDEGVSPSSSLSHEFPVICFSPRVMYNILSTAANY